MTTTLSLPATHRALVLSSFRTQPEVKLLPTPQPGPGSVVVKILAANVISYSGDIYNGHRAYPLPLPAVIGTSAIGRIAATGPDTVALSAGQLVFIDSFIRGRDDRNSAFLFGVHEGNTAGSKKLMGGEWRDATYAEYAKVPLENCHPLNEKALCGTLGYEAEQLTALSRFAVPYGGLSDVKIKPGETVIIAPATGDFGGAAVRVALAMGARVIAMGRSASKLATLAATHERIETVLITGDWQADLKALKEFSPIDAYFDISPPEAVDSTHMTSAIYALKTGGRMALMGGLNTDIAIPHQLFMHRDLSMKGRWMYDREDVDALIKMVEIGLLKLGEKGGMEMPIKFNLEDWGKAFDCAAENAGGSIATVIVPCYT